MRRTPLLIESVRPSDHYIAVKLSPKSRERLLSSVPASHPNVQGDHVTLVAHPTPADIKRFQELHGKQVAFHATHHAKSDDHGVHAVRVKGLDHLSDKEHKHVTISTGHGVPAARSNDLLAQHKGDRLPDWIRLNGTIEVAKRLGRK